VLTLGEVRKGIELLRGRDPAQAEVFASWLGELHTRFADRIVPIDARIAEEWGRLNAAATRNTVDSLIAATARIHGRTVVSRNTGDFEGCGVPLLNPWQPQSDASN
jgi:toxin FitB